MGFTLVVYSASKAANGLTFFPPLTDSHVTPVGNGIYTPDGYNRVLAAYVVGASVARGQLQAPSLRKYATTYIAPADNAANPSATPPVNDFFYSGLPVKTGDELDFFIDNGNTTERDFGFVWLGDGPKTPTTGDIFTAEATGSTALTVNTWTPVPLTFSTALEYGFYKLVGLFAHFNGGVAARMLLPGYPWRPGVPASTTANKRMPDRFRWGNSGEWLTFQEAAPPQIECLGTAATSSERFYLDLVKL